MLSNFNRVIVIEDNKVEPSCCPRAEKEYQVLSGDQNNQLLMIGDEQLDCCCRSLACICRRDFDIILKDNQKKHLYTLTHGRTCCSIFSCCSCCRHRFEVRRPDGVVAGRVEAECSMCCNCFPSFKVSDAKDTQVFRVSKDVNCCQSMCGTCNCCCCNCTMPIGYTISGKGRGSIERLPERRKEDTFVIDIPREATEEERVLLLGAAFLVDYALYDDKATNMAQGAPQQQHMR